MAAIVEAIIQFSANEPERDDVQVEHEVNDLSQKLSIELIERYRRQWPNDGSEFLS